jgi:methyl-accepting chemotaxis protein
VSAAAKRLTWGTLRDFTLAMQALGRGDLQAAHASVNIVPVQTNSRDELGEMAASFNLLQEQVRDAAFGLDEARENMRTARAELLERHEEIAHLAHRDALTAKSQYTHVPPHANLRARQGPRRDLCRAVDRSRPLQGGQ